MRIPRLKLSVPSLNLLIAGFALGLAADEYRHRYIACMKKATNYASEADLHRENVGIFDRHIKEAQSRVDAGLADGSQLETLGSEREKARRLVDMCEDMRSRFEHAARIPFASTPEEVIIDSQYYSLPIHFYDELSCTMHDQPVYVKSGDSHESSGPKTSHSSPPPSGRSGEVVRPDR